MNIWDPFHPIAYFLHTTLGIAGIIGAFVALTATKGSFSHVWAGRSFALAAVVAAATAIAFSLTAFAPMAVASAVMAISAVGSAFLALRNKNHQVIAGELVMAVLMALVSMWLLYGAWMSAPQGGLLWIPPLLLAAFPAALVVNDLRYMRSGNAERESKRLQRHLSRMGLAIAIAVHSPMVVFADRLGIHPGAAFYGPFIIWPVIVVLFNNRLKKNLIVVENRRS